MRAIFISYRREDAEGQAGRLFNDLATEFGQDAVFMDVAGIEPGRDFRRVIDQHVASCGVLLGMIGKSWINASDESGRRRLDDPMDFVRLETASALKRDIPVIPVLIQGAAMPRAEQLPPDLADLAFRNAVELTHARWDSDVQVLIKALRPYVQVNPPAMDRPNAQTVSTAPHGAVSGRTMIEAPVEAISPPAVHEPPRAASRVIGMAVAGLVVFAMGGYAWYSRSSPPDISTAAAPATPAQPPGSEVPAKSAPDQKALVEPAPGRSDERNEDSTRRKAPSSDERDSDAQEPVDKPPVSQRARWRSYEFPPPNAGAVMFTIMPGDNPACASYDGANCLWGVTYDQLDFAQLKPLVCGEGHRAAWGVTGYEDPKHWCSLARKLIGD